MAVAHTNHAQAPPPPPADKGTNNNKAPGSGGGAPIDGGLILSLTMVAGFGAWKLCKVLRKASSQTNTNNETRGRLVKIFPFLTFYLRFQKEDLPSGVCRENRAKQTGPSGWKRNCCNS